jgi:3-dehydrotetronate 4-kinase
MTDANLVRVLQSQTKCKVGLVEFATVSQGSDAIIQRFAALRRDGYGFAIVDALSNNDLVELGTACADLPLVTAGSGVALGLPQNFRHMGLLPDNIVADTLPPVGGQRAVIAGSCSAATQGQVALMRQHHPAFKVEPAELASGKNVVSAALDWAESRIGTEPVLVYATAEPAEVKVAQTALGVDEAGALVERALAAIARGLVERGVGRLIVAGGETSGAVVKALGVRGLRIGPEIDPGVPWTVALQDGVRNPLALALKSGNFGTQDFFLKAWDRLQ